jgi:ABC-type Fe3+ transport system permease subunit
MFSKVCFIHLIATALPFFTDWARKTCNVEGWSVCTTAYPHKQSYGRQKVPPRTSLLPAHKALLLGCCSMRYYDEVKCSALFPLASDNYYADASELHCHHLKHQLSAALNSILLALPSFPAAGTCACCYAKIGARFRQSKNDLLALPH